MSTVLHRLEAVEPRPQASLQARRTALHLRRRNLNVACRPTSRTPTVNTITSNRHLLPQTTGMDLDHRLNPRGRDGRRTKRINIPAVRLRPRTPTPSTFTLFSVPQMRQERGL